MYHHAVIRGLIFLLVVGMLAYCGATVKLGKKTAFAHILSIWKADETREMVDGVKETGGPVVDKVKRGIEAGYRQVTSGSPAEPVGAAPTPRRPAAGEPDAAAPER